MFENSFAYSIYDSHKLVIAPTNHMINQGKSLLNNLSFDYFPQYLNHMKAVYEITERLTKNYDKLQFDINEIVIDGQEINITEKIIDTKPFARLINFKKNVKIKQKKLLIVAPMSGHHATLLRDTVKSFLPYFDVYITDWIDAKYVPVSEGSFNMDDYIDYVINYFKLLGSELNVMAVCQPTVPVVAATAIMEASKSKYVPKSLILMGGPVDTRFNPTEIDKFAVSKNIGWFKSNLISRVPINYPGAGRAVYPGFIQVTSFMLMNLDRHIGSHRDMFNLIAKGDSIGAQKQKKFYDEYLSVMDLTSEFYLQTVEKVFKNHDLPRGKMISRDRVVDLTSITKPYIFTIEGENDDITGLGQTKAILKLCKNLSKAKKSYHMQEDVGHYGVFSGSRFREHIVPLVKDFIDKIK